MARPSRAIHPVRRHLAIPAYGIGTRLHVPVARLQLRGAVKWSVTSQWLGVGKGQEREEGVSQLIRSVDTMTRPFIGISLVPRSHHHPHSIIHSLLRDRAVRKGHLVLC